ncbi:M67 family peptidase [Sphingomonas koreensis]|nr:M67 family peptidase [Sphingomonas koreensis]
MSARISSAALQQIIAHAAAFPQLEVCGLLFGDADVIEAIEPCANVAEDRATRFEIDPARLLAAHRAMRSGGARLIGHYHSHPRGSATPSARDAQAAAADGAIWLIVAGGAVDAYRAVDHGEIEGRFAPLALDIMTSPCAGGDAPPEEAQLKDLGGEFS